MTTEPAAPAPTAAAADVTPTAASPANPLAEPLVADPPAAAPTQTPPAGTSWRDTLEGDLAGNEKFSNFDSVSKLAQAYLDTPTPAEVPKAEDYKIPEGVELPHFAEFANKSGLSQDQVNGILEYQRTLSGTQMEDYENGLLSGLDEVYTEWGESKETNLSLAQRALSQFDTDGTMKQFLNESRAGNHPLVVKFLYSIGKTLEEDGFLKSEVNSPKPQKSVADTLYPNQGN